MRRAKNGRMILIVTLFLLSLVVVAPFARFSSYNVAYGQGSTVTFDKDNALQFLKSLYNNSTELASEYNGSETYWIYNDNALLFQIFNIYQNSNVTGINETRNKIGDTIDNYSKYVGEGYDDGNDRIEVLFNNKTILYPPYTSTGYYYSPIIADDMNLTANLIPNPTVENGSQSPDYWFHSDPNMIATLWSSDHARSGLKSIGLNVTSENADWRSSSFAVEPLGNYLVRCYVEGNVIGGNWYIYLRWFNSSQQWIGENFTQICPGTYSNWTQLVLFNFNCPSEARYADVRFLTQNGTGELYADDFDAERIIDSDSFIVRNDRKYIQIPDWQSYADLFVYGIIDEWWLNDRTKALTDLATLVNTMCTPEGVNDGKSGDEYQTYKVALVLICRQILGQSIPYNYTQILCQMQMPNGGFRTGYLPGIIPNPNATENVETTCLALYALNDPPKPWRTIPEFSSFIVLLICLSLPTVIILAKKRSVKMHTKKI